MAEQETGGEQIARARRVDNFRDGFGRHMGLFAPAHGMGAVFAAGDHNGRHLCGKLFKACVKIFNAGQSRQFVFVGKQDVDLARFDQRAEIVAGVAVVAPGGSLVVYNGERSKTYAFSELKEYQGARAQRGAVLTRGWRAVTRLEAIAPAD